MPFYTFRDKETGEEFETSLRMSELDQFIADNPNLQQVIGAPNVVDPYRIGVSKNPDSFKDLLRNVKKHHPKGNVNV